MMTLDIQVFHLLNSLAGQSPYLDGLIVFLASYLAYVLVALLLVLVFFSHYSKREKLEILLVAGISSVIAKYGITEIIRFFYHRPRPFSALQDISQLLANDAWSFPSGHATFFFAMAMAICLYNKKWGILFFVGAVVITLGRVIAGVHYPSDILGGALIGIVVAYATFYGYRRFKNNTSTAEESLN